MKIWREIEVFGTVFIGKTKKRRLNWSVQIHIEYWWHRCKPFLWNKQHKKSQRSSIQNIQEICEVFKILQDYDDNINNISLLTHVDVATKDNKYDCIKVLLSMILTEWCHYGIVCLMVLWTLILLIVLKVNWINFRLIQMFYVTGKPTLLGPETEVYGRCNVFFLKIGLC